MFCMAAIGAEREGYLKIAQAADPDLVLDGCPTVCGHPMTRAWALHRNGWAERGLYLSYSQTSHWPLVEDAPLRAA